MRRFLTYLTVLLLTAGLARATSYIYPIVNPALSGSANFSGITNPAQVLAELGGGTNFTPSSTIPGLYLILTGSNLVLSGTPTTFAGAGSAATYSATNDPTQSGTGQLMTAWATQYLFATGSSSGGSVSATTGNIIQFKYGTQDRVSAYVPLPNEPVYATDTQTFSIGDGTTLGGIVPNNGKWSYANRLYSDIVFGDNSIALGGSTSANAVLGSGNVAGIPYACTLNNSTGVVTLTGTASTGVDFQVGDTVLLKFTPTSGKRPWQLATITGTTGLTGSTTSTLTLSGTIPGYSSAPILYAFRKDSGGHSLLLGSNLVGYNSSVTVGYNSTNSGSNSVVVGSNSVSVAPNAIVLGNNIKADKKGELVLGSSSNTQVSVVCLMGTTLNTEVVELSTDGLTATGATQYDSAGNLNTNRYWLNNNTSYDCMIKITAREAGGNSAHWQRQVLVHNSSGTCVIDSAQVIGTDYDPRGWSMTIGLASGSPVLQVIVSSGTIFDPIQWMASVTANEVVR